MSDLTFERFATIFSCFLIFMMIYYYFLIKSLLDKLDEVETEQELLEIKKEISDSSFNLFLMSVIPLILNLIFGFD